MSDSMQEFDRLPKQLLDELSNVIRENRKILEEAIIKSVRKLLNTHYERQKLDAQHSVIQSLMSTKSKRKKQLVNEATQKLKDGTVTAPMGSGAAANIALTIAGSAAGAIIDSAEEKRQFTEAQKKLEAAQMQIYVSTPDNYTLIARKVARKISFKIQLLLGVVSPEGLEVLAEIFKKSMKKYAIERLQEYHSTNAVDEIVCALVDAAIPPHTDSLIYREWLKIDIANYKFNWRFLSRVALSLNEYVQETLRHAGPTTQMLLGGQNVIVDSESLTEVQHKDFTVLGALNHANIIGQDFMLATGIERPHELLGFNFKYPLLLQAPGDTLGSMGLNFAPRPTGIKLEPILQRVLLELVPNFNDPKAIEVSAREIREGRVIIPTINKRHLSHKRNAVPWSVARQNSMLARYKALYTAGQTAKLQINPEEITTISNFSRLQAMRKAGDEFDLTYARDDVLHAEIEAQQAQNSIYTCISNDINMTQQRLNAAIAAKYLATSTSNFIHCLLKSGGYSIEDIILATYLIEVARSTLNSSRIGPIQEVQQFSSVHKAVARAKEFAEKCYTIQDLYHNKISLLMENFIPTESKFYTIEQQVAAQKRKNTIRQIKDNIFVLKKLTKMAKAITTIKENDENVEHETEEQALSNFESAAVKIYRKIYSIDDNRSPLTDIINVIEIYAHETRILFDAISRCNQGMSQEIVEAFNRAIRNIATAKERYEHRSRYEKVVSETAARQEIINLKNDSATNRDLCRNRLQELEESIADLNEQDQAFFERAKAYSQLGRTLFLVSQHRAPETLEEDTKDLKEKVKNIYLAVRDGRANLASSAYDDMITENSDLKSDLKISELIKRAKAISQARDEIEVAISGDIEMTRLATMQAKNAVNNIRTIKREMEDAESRIVSLIIDLESEPYAENTNPSNQTSLQQIRELHTMISSDATNPSGETIIDEYTLTIFQTLRKIISTEAQSERIQEGETNTKTLDLKIKLEIISNIEMLLPIKDDSIASMHDSTSFSESDPGSQNSISSSINNWGVWLIVKALHCQLQNMLNSADGLLAQIAATEQELRKIENIDDLEADELSENKRIAIQKIKHAYQDILLAEQEKSRLNSNSCDHEVSTNLVVEGMLKWASRLTYREQQWLDEEKASKLQSILERQQEYRLQSIIVDPKLIIFISNALDNLQTEKRQYNGLSNRISQKITNIDRLYPPTQTQKRDPVLSRISASFERLNQIIDKKIEMISTKSEKLEKCKKSFTRQILRAYFGYLKLEIDYSETIKEESRVFEDIIEQKSRKSKVSSATEKNKSIKFTHYLHGKDTQIERSASIYSFFDIKDHYDQLNIQYRAVIQELESSKLITHSVEEFDSEPENEDLYAAHPTSYRKASSPRKTPHQTFSGSLRLSNSGVFKCQTSSAPEIKTNAEINIEGTQKQNALIQELHTTNFCRK